MLERGQRRMMTDDLLAREKEFRRVNRELDERTRHLLEEIESVVNSQPRNVFSPEILGNFRPHLSTAFDDFFAEPPLNIDYNYPRQIQNLDNKDNNCMSPAADDEVQSTSGKKNVEALDDDLGVFKDNHKSKNDATIRFLKAKIKMVIVELQTMKDEYKKKCNYCKDLEAENKKINESKDKLYNQLTSLKDNIAKLESNIANHQSELQTNSTEKNTLKKEVDCLKKEVKALNQHANNLDLRINRSLEDNEKLKNTIKLNKIEEKELRNQVRKLQDDEKQVLKCLERQNFEILQAFKKQSLLIDNLKKQKAYLEASKQVQLTREDFLKILDWKPDDR